MPESFDSGQFNRCGSVLLSGLQQLTLTRLRSFPTVLDDGLSFALTKIELHQVPGENLGEHLDHTRDLHIEHIWRPGDQGNGLIVNKSYINDMFTLITITFAHKDITMYIISKEKSDTLSMQDGMDLLQGHRIRYIEHFRSETAALSTASHSYKNVAVRVDGEPRTFMQRRKQLHDMMIYSFRL